MNQPWIYMCSPSWTSLPPPSPSHLSGSSQCTSPEHLSHESSLDWHLIIYIFQCCSLRSSHPRLLPQSPKFWSIHLCLFFCLAYRVIVKIWNASRICVSSLHRGHANLLGIVPILVYVLPKWALELRLPGEISITSDTQMTPQWW